MEIKYPCKNQCKSVTWCHPGLKGTNADLTKLLFILHRPDERVHQMSLLGSEQNYLNVLTKTKTGKTLGGLLTFCGLTLDDIYLTNALKCVFGNENMVKLEGYLRCRKVLEDQIIEFEPRKIVGFGVPVRNALFNDKRKIYEKTDQGVVLEYSKEKILALIVPHLSSIWALRNQQKINQIFKKVKEFICN